MDAHTRISVYNLTRHEHWSFQINVFCKPHNVYMDNYVSDDRHLPTYRLYFNGRYFIVAKLGTNLNYRVKTLGTVALFISVLDILNSIGHHTCSWQPVPAVFRSVWSCFVSFSLRQNKYMEFISIYVFFGGSARVCRFVIHFLLTFFVRFFSVIHRVYPFIHASFHLFIYLFIHWFIHSFIHISNSWHTTLLKSRNKLYGK